jgi:hypothetical protein
MSFFEKLNKILSSTTYVFSLHVTETLANTSFLIIFPIKKGKNGASPPPLRPQFSSARSARRLALRAQWGSGSAAIFALFYGKNDQKRGICEGFCNVQRKNVRSRT